MARRKNMNKRRRLLIVACSARKHPLDGRVPALDLYDGVAFRTLKKLRRENEFPDDVDVVILSAKYGLLRSGDLIEAYDLKMTSEIAKQQAEENVSELRRLLAQDHYREVFVSLGQTYCMAIRPTDAWQRSGVVVKKNRGRIGEQLKALKGWLLNGNGRRVSH